MPFDIAWVRSQFPGRRIDWHNVIDSTMFAAGRLAEQGCPSGTVSGAEEQTAGHGRHGRAWYSAPEAGLYVSIVLRYQLPPESLPVITLALGLAAADAILQSTGVRCDLRWPNDVLVSGKKCAGILPQLEAGAIIAGFGINVNHAAFPAEIAPLATSLLIETGRPHSRERLLVALIPAVENWCEILERRGAWPVLDAFARASSFVNGRKVQIEDERENLRGTTAGLNSAGFLLLRDETGAIHTVIAGGVRPCS